MMARTKAAEDKPTGVSVQRRRIVVVDDHVLVRESLCELLNQEPDLAIVGQASDAGEASVLCGELSPDAIVLDLTLGRDSAFTLVPVLRAAHPNAAILILSMHDEMVFAERALKNGANGYVMKNERLPVLLSALRRVLEGKTYVSERVSEMLLRSLSGGSGEGHEPSRLSRLSNRELEILRYIGQGMKSAKIAAMLHLSAKTVEAHREHIKDKLAVQTSAELTVLAVNWLRDGFLEPSQPK
jgi:DNA-binding NarL/FixJ family response regulator